MATNPTPIPIPIHPVPPASTSVPIAAVRDFHTLQEAIKGAHSHNDDNDQRDNGDDDDGRDVEEGELGGNTLEDGGMKIGMPAAHDDDGHALLSFDVRLKGAMDVPRTMILRPLPCPPLPASPNVNIGIPCTMDLPQPPHTGEFPIICVGDYVPAVRKDPRCPGHRGSLPYSDPHPFRPVFIPTA
ncbi:hypothetical protein EDD85DRAFT_1017490 [Armillaria nabsnona]|nr:hypothetical protein EDD85DRAFT_1017490 [Armillaria nabsnona]